jgi:nucleotide-binding universal stress UspA family protein
VTAIIAAVDNSVAAGPVLSAALAFAPALGADVEAINVDEDGGLTAKASADTLGIAYRQLTGDPHQQICEQASRPEVVAVVMGARERIGGRRTGHLVQQVADTIDKPVLVVSPDVTPLTRVHIVVIAMEGTARNSKSLKQAVSVAAGADLDLIVVHVDDEDSIPSFSDQVAHETDAYASEFLARNVHGAPNARLELRIGVPADEIIKAADSLQADLLAVGWPQSHEAHKGMTAREILDRSHVPVLLVAVRDHAEGA